VKELDEVQVSQAAKCDEERELKRQLAVYKEEASRYCLTADCVRTTDDIIRRMDLAVDPCHDFWLYACGGWLRDNRHQPVDGEATGVQHEVDQSVSQSVRCFIHAWGDVTSQSLRLRYDRHFVGITRDIMRTSS